MKFKNTVILLLIGAVLLVGGIYFFAGNSVLPIENDTVSDIEFRVYPQDTRCYTVTDDNRVNEIVFAINSLSVEKCDTRPERMGEYYYSINLNCLGDNDIWVEFDEKIISLKNENYAADTTALHELLEKTYHDIKYWNIE